MRRLRNCEITSSSMTIGSCRPDLWQQGKPLPGPSLTSGMRAKARSPFLCGSSRARATFPLRIREDAKLCVVGLRGRQVQIRSIERTEDLRYRFEAVVTSLIREVVRDDVSAPAASSPKLKRRRVVLVKPSMDQIARRRSGLIWKRDVPGAWLTHRVPKVREASLPDEISEDLSSLDTSRK